MQIKFGRTWLIVLLVSVAAYSLAGFFVAPRAIKHWLENSAAAGTDCRLGVREVTVNPFTLFLSLNNVTLLETENKLFVSVGSLETRLWSLERFRAKRDGYDVEFRDIVVASAPGENVDLAIPTLSATGVTMNERSDVVTISGGRAEGSTLRIARDRQGDFRLPGWFPLTTESSGKACVAIDSLRVSEGQLQFTDNAVSPTLRQEVTDIAGKIERQRGNGESSLDLKGTLDESAVVSFAARWPLAGGVDATTLDLDLQRISFARLSPYFAALAGRDIAAGIGDLELYHGRRDSAVEAEVRIVVDGLEIGEPALANTEADLPLDLALALVTDENDRIDVSIPAREGEATPGAKAMQIFAGSISSYIQDVSSAPFEMLADLVGNPDLELDLLSFIPGSAEATPEAEEKIALLADALVRRPLLAVRAQPVYDPVADRDAIAAQQVRLHVDLATSAGPRGSGGGAPLNFDDPKVQDILDEFAGERLLNSQRRAIANDHDDRDRDYFKAVFEALGANETVSETTLRRLARFRATSVVNALARSGIDRERLGIADDIDTSVSDAEAISVRLTAIQ